MNDISFCYATLRGVGVVAKVPQPDGGILRAAGHHAAARVVADASDGVNRPYNIYSIAQHIIHGYTENNE